MQKVRFFV